MSGKWTPEQLERLDALWGEGKTGREIGEVLGFSRRAVLGQVFRRKLPKRWGGGRMASKPAATLLEPSTPVSAAVTPEA